MKMRKLVAGLAAAATLLGGLALGAAGAHAAETPSLPYKPLADGQVDDNGKVTADATFVFGSDDARQWGTGNNRVIEAYKLADYYQYLDSSDDPTAVFGVQTADAAKEGVKDALGTALAEYPSKTDPVTIPTDGTDLLAWALQNDYLDQSANKPWTTNDNIPNPVTDSTTRKFADALSKTDTLKKLGTPTELSVANGKLNLKSKDGKTYTANLPAGIYLFLDVTKSDADGAGTATNKDKNWIQNGKENDATSFGEVVVNSAPIILASGHLTPDGTQGENYLYPLGDPAQGDNTVDFKNHVTPVTKTVDDTDKTVSTSQTVRYTLSSTLPLTTGYDPKTYVFTLQDFPGAGQTVNLDGFDEANAENPTADLSDPTTLRNNAGKYTVKVYDTDENGDLIDGDAKTDGVQPVLLKTLTEGTDFDLTTSANNGKEIVGAADKKAHFTLNFSKLIQNDVYNNGAEKDDQAGTSAYKHLWGKKVVVEYAAKITATKATTDADPNSAVKNTVEVNDNNAVASHGTKLTLGQFSFTKTDAQGSSNADINGATFVISPYSKTHGNTAVSTNDPDMTGVKDVNRDGQITDDDIDHVLTPWKGEGINTSDSRVVEGKNGIVTFTGLADGTYLVEETKAPEGFLSGQVYVRFTVDIKGGKAIAFHGIDVWGLAPTNAGDGQTEITDYKVKNVRNIAELPKTGAAGIILFGVVAALLAAAGVTVYLKSRATKRALYA